MSGAVVVGIGQPFAGDDGVGVVVARALAGRGVSVRESTDASVLLPLLEEGRRVIVVDAVVGGGQPGDVVRLDLRALASGPVPLSSHGLGVVEALALAGTLYGEECLGGVELVGIVIERPEGRGEGLSAEVTQAVASAVRVVHELLANLVAPSRRGR